MDPTPTDELDRAVDTLRAASERWTQTSIPDRRALLQRLIAQSLAAARPQVEAACQAKGLPVDRPRAAEEWLGGPGCTIRNLRLLDETLAQLHAGGPPRLAGPLRQRPDGQLVAPVFPTGLNDKLLFAGFTADVWLEPGIAKDAVGDAMAAIYRPGAERRGKVALVLGAGNVASIGPMDVLYKLFVEDQVVLLKMNPVNEYLGPHVEAGFKALVDADLLRVVYGAGDVGAYLVDHPGIDEVHITGSARVHDLIVWGPGDEGEALRAAGTPRTTKRITSELGCVTPVIVVPGQWSERELSFQAANIATMMANNASFNCNAAKVLITHRDWPQRQQLLERLTGILATLPPRAAYYPGSAERYERFMNAHPESTRHGETRDGAIPWTLIPDVDAANADEICFREEAWCALLADTPLDASDPADFLSKAVAFANDRMWGTLSGNILIDPRSERALSSELDAAIAAMRYGGVAVNHWAALCYGLVSPTWGAYPGHTLADIQSGIGVVHNTLMFDRPQKSVVRGPFTMTPKPPWFVTHTNAHNVARRIAAFEARPSLLKIPAIALAALRG